MECIYPLKTSILGHFNVQPQVSSLRVVGFSLPCFGLEDSVDTNFPLMDIRWSRIPSLDLNSVTVVSTHSKNISENGNLSPSRGENEKYLKPPPTIRV